MLVANTLTVNSAYETLQDEYNSLNDKLQTNSNNEALVIRDATATTLPASTVDVSVAPFITTSIGSTVMYV